MCQLKHQFNVNIIIMIINLIVVVFVVVAAAAVVDIFRDFAHISKHL